MNEYKYIIVDGLIKSGKSGLARILAEEFDARLILDNKDNPFLEEFYDLLAGAGDSLTLKTQLIFLLNRYSQQLEIKQKGLFQETTVSDYAFWRDHIYAQVVLNNEELDIYRKIFKIFSENIAHADLVIYLQTSFAEMLRRIRERGTEAEKKAPPEYWRDVFEAYNYFFFTYKNSPLLVVNMEKVDLDNPEDIRRLMAEIKTPKKGTRYYAPT